MQALPPSRLIHIVRDPRAGCWSLIKRSRRSGERRNGALLCVTGATGWLFANLACELFNYFYRYRRVRYENLANSLALGRGKPSAK